MIKAVRVSATQVDTEIVSSTVFQIATAEAKIAVGLPGIPGPPGEAGEQGQPGEGATLSDGIVIDGGNF